jgi:hypothetical protein
MSTHDQPVVKHRHSPSIPQQGSCGSPQPTQPALPHVPRFALIHDLATGTQTHAPITYLFSDEHHPPFSANDATHTLIVDLSPDGEKVMQAQSLSEEWQLVSAKVGTTARTTNIEGGETSAGNTVLNIDGLGQFTPPVRSDNIFDLARQFSERYTICVVSLSQERDDPSIN